jgi:hypothetical protein
MDLPGACLTNGYGKEQVERAFAEAYPGYALRIGQLNYAVVAKHGAQLEPVPGAKAVTLKELASVQPHPVV